MPKAAVDEDYGSVLRKNKVWFARQPLVVKEVAKTLCMQTSPDGHFGLGVLAADASHHPAPNSNRNDVSHKRKLGPAPG